MTSGWRPSSVGEFDFDSTIIFFYTEDPEISICKEGSSRSYVLCKKKSGYYSGYIPVKIVIFSNGIMNRGKYGLRIYSPENGSLVYDSSNQVLVNPQLVSPPQSLYSFVNIPHITRPMYLPTSVGGLYSNKYNSEVSIVSNGFQIASGWGINRVVKASHGGDILSISKEPVIFIDAQDYFKF